MGSKNLLVFLILLIILIGVIEIVSAECGDLIPDTGEACDDGNTITETCGDGTIQSGTYCNADCTAELTLSEQCESDSDCSTGEVCDECLCIPEPVCGNDVAEGNEECDGSDLKGETCESQLGLGYTGTLSCIASGETNECNFDITGCIPPSSTPSPVSGSATDCEVVLKENCDKNIALRLSDTENAHGQVWNYNNEENLYDYVLCCGGSQGDKIHDCSENNVLIRLSAETNAHAEIPEGVTFGEISDGTETPIQTETSSHLIKDRYWACLSQSSYHYDYCSTNSLPILNQQDGYKYYETDFQFTAHPGMKVYLSDMTNPDNGLFVIDDRIVITTPLGTFDKQESEKVIRSARIDITNLFLTGSETEPVTIDVNVKLYDVYGDMVGNTPLYIEERTPSGETPPPANYIDVCYNNLVCESGTDCEEREVEILSLSDLTNAHIAEPGIYPIKICCREAVSIEGASWRNMMFQVIDVADLNDLVMLYVSGEGLQDKTIEYQIYKDIPFWFDSKVADVSVEGYTTWRAGSDDSGNLEAGTYYFEATIVETGEKFTSGNLEVSEIELNNPPIANIFKPHDGEMFMKDQFINFSADGSGDEDDGISLTWDITHPDDPFYLWNFTEKYDSFGQKNLLLTLTDDRSLSSSDFKSILIVQEGLNIFANIDSPEGVDPILQDEVLFSADGTYVVDCAAVACDLCDEDPCPITPGNCVQVGSDESGYLNCTYKDNQDPENWVSLNWSIYKEIEENIWEKIYNISGKWGEYIPAGSGIIGEGVYNEFTKNLITGKYRIILVASTNPSSSDEVEIVVNVDNEPVCDNGREWILPDGSVMPSFPDNCMLEDIDNTCCPDGWICQGVAGDSQCVPSDDFFCGNFENEEECGPPYDTLVAERTIEEFSGLGCGAALDDIGCLFVVNCRCEWNSVNNICEARYDLTDICLHDEITVGECIYTMADSATECVNGLITLSWIAEWTGSPDDPYAKYCVSGEKTVPCPTTIKLTFFTIKNLIIAVLIIILIYIILNSIKKERIKKFKKRKNPKKRS